MPSPPPRLPLVSVKLDRRFIIDAAENAGDAMLLASVVQLAHAQKLYVIAEGTETLAQFELAPASGCDAIQGYYLARPMTAPALEAWLSARDATQPGHDRRQTVHALPFDGGALKHGL